MIKRKTINDRIQKREWIKLIATFVVFSIGMCALLWISELAMPIIHRLSLDYLGKMVTAFMVGAYIIGFLLKAVFERFSATGLVTRPYEEKKMLLAMLTRDVAEYEAESGIIFDPENLNYIDKPNEEKK